MEEIVLHNTRGSHNKQYRIKLVSLGSQYKVTTHWGRIETPSNRLQSTILYNGSSLPEAKDRIENKLEEKLNRGYHVSTLDGRIIPRIYRSLAGSELDWSGPEIDRDSERENNITTVRTHTLTTPSGKTTIRRRHKRRLKTNRKGYLVGYRKSTSKKKEKTYQTKIVRISDLGAWSDMKREFNTAAAKKWHTVPEAVETVAAMKNANERYCLGNVKVGSDWKRVAIFGISVSDGQLMNYIPQTKKLAYHKSLLKNLGSYVSRNVHDLQLYTHGRLDQKQLNFFKNLGFRGRARLLVFEIPRQVERRRSSLTRENKVV